MSDNVHFGLIDQFDPYKHYDELDDVFSQILIKYHCVDIPDDIVNEWVYDIDHIYTHWHWYGREAKGLAQCGVTLIPPESLNDVLCVIQQYLLLSTCSEKNNSKIKSLLNLLNEAKMQKKWVIHFGL